MPAPRMALLMSHLRTAIINLENPCQDSSVAPNIRKKEKTHIICKIAFKMGGAKWAGLVENDPPSQII